MQYNFVEYFKTLNLYSLIDLVLVLIGLVIVSTFFLYKKNVRMLIVLFVGVIMEIMLNVLSELIGGAALTVSRYCAHYIVLFEIIVCCVVYQTDFKNIFQKVAKSKYLDTHSTEDELREATAEIMSACQDMSKQDVGALIIIDSQGDIHENILDTGTILNATLSAPLLISIFNTKAPLHDGAVVVRGNKIVAAGCFLTLTQKNVNKEMGTRHRAAIGVTEDTDVLSIVVSEETGIISVVEHGEIKRYMTMDKLKDELENAFGISPTALAKRNQQTKKKKFGRKSRFDDIDLESLNINGNNDIWKR